jgi:hypothetical protein
VTTFLLHAVLALLVLVAGCLAVRFVAPPAILATSRLVQRAVAFSAAVLLWPDGRSTSLRKGWSTAAVTVYGSLVAAVAGLVLRGVDRVSGAAAAVCRSVHPMLVGVILLALLVVASVAA